MLRLQGSTYKSRIRALDELDEEYISEGRSQFRCHPGSKKHTSWRFRFTPKPFPGSLSSKNLAEVYGSINLSYFPPSIRRFQIIDPRGAGAWPPRLRTKKYPRNRTSPSVLQHAILCCMQYMAEWQPRRTQIAAAAPTDGFARFNT